MPRGRRIANTIALSSSESTHSANLATSGCWTVAAPNSEATSRCRRARNARVSFHAWNCAQVVVDGSKVPIRHVLIERPRHYLENRAKLRMSMIVVEAGAHCLHELGQRAPGWPSGL